LLCCSIQEVSYRRDRRLLARLRYARLRHQASVEDIDYRAARGLDRALFQKLTAGNWIDAHGKSWLASALGHWSRSIPRCSRRISRS
jgi:hypothetical protein